MVQIIEEAPGIGARFAQGLSKGLSGESKGLVAQFGEMARQKKMQEAAANKIKELTGFDVSGLTPDLQKVFLAEALSSQAKTAESQRKQEWLRELLGEPSQGLGAQPEAMGGFEGGMGAKELPGFMEAPGMQGMGAKTQLEAPGRKIEGRGGKPYSDRQILVASLDNAPLAREMRAANDAWEKRSEKERQFQREEFKSEREYHTKFSMDAEKEADALRESLIKKESALDLSRQAVEQGDPSFFSLDSLADRTGFGVFRTAKGAQLITAGKENLLSNMSRISAKAQNQWFEQRLNSMFPQIGQSQEANLTIQEMLEGEEAMDRAYLNEFDKIAESDMEKEGFVRKDIKKRAQKNTELLNREIMKRTNYRLKQIEEKEMGSDKLRAQVGKNVVQGTPLTLEMMRLYVKKFNGDKAKAEQVAKKNGYYIPTADEIELFQMRPTDFRQNL